MHLRRATAADLELLSRWYGHLRADEGADNPMTSEEVATQMASFLGGSTYEIHVLVVDGEDAGYGMVDVTRTPRYLRHLFIEPALRRKGLGRRLIELIVATFPDPAIDIEVLAWNRPAIAFYERLGFALRYHGMRLRSRLAGRAGHSPGSRPGLGPE